MNTKPRYRLTNKSIEGGGKLIKLCATLDNNLYHFIEIKENRVSELQKFLKLLVEEQNKKLDLTVQVKDGIYVEGRKILIIEPFDVSLNTIFNQNNSIFFTEVKALCIFFNIYKWVTYYGSRGFTNTKLSPSNVVRIKNKWKVHLPDCYFVTEITREIFSKNKLYEFRNFYSDDEISADLYSAIQILHFMIFGESIYENFTTWIKSSNLASNMTDFELDHIFDIFVTRRPSFPELYKFVDKRISELFIFISEHNFNKEHIHDQLSNLYDYYMYLSKNNIPGNKIIKNKEYF